MVRERGQPFKTGRNTFRNTEIRVRSVIHIGMCVLGLVTVGHVCVLLIK